MLNRPRVVWLHSLARSGSSITVYAAACAARCAVADEIIGPWHRTTPPYNYPQAQSDLVDLFKGSDHALTGPVVDLTNQVLTQIAGSSPIIISKWPHLRPTPAQFDRAFPDDRRVYLIRNPLLRLNSLYSRGWLKSIGAEHDLPRFKQFARWWRQQPNRITFDQLRTDPRAFFTRLFEAWEIDLSGSQIDAAIRYMSGNYHDSSLSKADPPRAAVLSERAFALPPDALELYLSDPFVLDLMDELNWSTDPAHYGAQPEGSM